MALFGGKNWPVTRLWKPFLFVGSLARAAEDSRAASYDDDWYTEEHPYAFEPEDNNAACFEETVRKNGITNVALHKRAVGRSLGTASFDRRGGAFSDRLIDGSTLYAPTENLVTVELVSIDHLVGEEGLRPPDIMKIDVEGNEVMVVEGMEETLKTRRPILICELHEHLGDAREGFIRHLQGAGYDIMDAAAIEEGRQSVDASDLSQARHIVAVERI